jgi:hypothetical protein
MNLAPSARVTGAHSLSKASTVALSRHCAPKTENPGYSSESASAVSASIQCDGCLSKANPQYRTRAFIGVAIQAHVKPARGARIVKKLVIVTRAGFLIFRGAKRSCVAGGVQRRSLRYTERQEGMGAPS